MRKCCGSLRLASRTSFGVRLFQVTTQQHVHESGEASHQAEAEAGPGGLTSLLSHVKNVGITLVSSKRNSNIQRDAIGSIIRRTDSVVRQFT